MKKINVKKCPCMGKDSLEEQAIQTVSIHHKFMETTPWLMKIYEYLLSQCSPRLMQSTVDANGILPSLLVAKDVLIF